MPRYFKKARQINNLKVIDGLVRESESMKKSL